MNKKLYPFIFLPLFSRVENSGFLFMTLVKVDHKRVSDEKKSKLS